MIWKTVQCSHGRATKYFIESILAGPGKFLSSPCSSYVKFTIGLCDDCSSNINRKRCASMGEYSIFPRFALIYFLFKMFYKVMKIVFFHQGIRSIFLENKSRFPILTWMNGIACRYNYNEARRRTKFVHKMRNFLLLLVKYNECIINVWVLNRSSNWIQMT